MATPVRVASAKARSVHRKAAAITFGGLVKSDLAHLVTQVEGGLPAGVVDQGAEYLSVPKAEFVKILQISSSTLSRWFRDSVPLPHAESDRIARIARVTMIVEDALGSRDDAVDWLNSKIPALGNAKPLAMLGSDAGVKIVEDLLIRAQAGVYG